MNQKEFLEQVRPYIVGEPKYTSHEVSVILKENVVGDIRKYSELKMLSMKVGAVATMVPPGFRIPLVASTAMRNSSETKLLYLHESDIEDGGPQPRIEIRPDDPETVSLFESIKTKGQREPINVYPANGKYRIDDGHRRRMVIFNMLRKDGIWAFSKPSTEQEAYEDAFTLNFERKSLSDYELGRHLSMLMAKFPTSYPTQEVVAQKVGISRVRVNQFIRCFEEIERQKPRQDNIVNQFTMEKLSGTIVAEIKKAPEELKPAILENVVEKGLTVRQTEQLVKNLQEIENPTVETVAQEANRILTPEPELEPTLTPEPAEISIEEIVANLKQDAEKAVRTVTREIDRFIQNATGQYPEIVVREVYAHLNDPFQDRPSSKTSPEKFNQYCALSIGIAFEYLKKERKLDDLFAEADRW